MPKEKFYLSGQLEGDGNPPDFAVSWGTDHEGDSTTLISGPDEKPYIIAKPNDTAGLSRLIKALTRARTHMVQNRGAQPLVEVPDFLKVDHTRLRKPPKFPFGAGGIIEDAIEDWLHLAPLGTEVVLKDSPNGRLYRKERIDTSTRWRAGLNEPGDLKEPVLLSTAQLAALGPIGVFSVPEEATPKAGRHGE